MHTLVHTQNEWGALHGVGEAMRRHGHGKDHVPGNGPGGGGGGLGGGLGGHGPVD